MTQEWKNSILLTELNCKKDEHLDKDCLKFWGTDYSFKTYLFALHDHQLKV